MRGPFPFIPMSKCGAFCNPLAAPKSNPCAARRCGRSRRDGRHYSLPLVCSGEGRLLASLKMLTLQPTNHWLNPLGSGKILHQTQDMDRELWNDSLSQLSPLFFFSLNDKNKINSIFSPLSSHNFFFLICFEKPETFAKKKKTFFCIVNESKKGGRRKFIFKRLDVELFSFRKMLKIKIKNLILNDLANEGIWHTNLLK